MGQVVTAVNCSSCSSKKREKQLEKIYKKQLVPEPKKQRQESDSSIITDGAGSKPTESTEYGVLIDAKTMQLLSHINISTPIDDNIPTPTDNTSLTDNTASFELHPHEINVSDSRIKHLSNIKNLNELDQVLTEQYDNIRDHSDLELTDQYDDDDDDDKSSSYSEKELQQIQQIKTNNNSLSVDNEQLPNLLRPNTTSTWSDNDIYKLEKEMEKELAVLTPPGTGKDKLDDVLKKYKVMITSSDEDEDGDGINYPSSHLFRNKSKHKWDVNTMEITQIEMEKEMLHLVNLQSQKKQDSDTYVD